MMTKQWLRWIGLVVGTTLVVLMTLGAVAGAIGYVNTRHDRAVANSIRAARVRYAAKQAEAKTRLVDRLKAATDCRTIAQIAKDNQAEGVLFEEGQLAEIDGEFNAARWRASCN